MGHVVICYCGEPSVHSFGSPGPKAKASIPLSSVAKILWKADGSPSGTGGALGYTGHTFYLHFLTMHSSALYRLNVAVTPIALR